MKKIIRLTEGDLARIVRRVINEQLTKQQEEKIKELEAEIQKGIDKDIKNNTDLVKLTMDKYMSSNSYRIKAGDTLSGIASKFGKTLDQLIKLNPGIDDPNKIFTGNLINVK